ncbi:LysR family transcriptional regulator [Psychromicrobium sp. YIM B11713]|uniref:LysR family transcriptional regulator n=1 Tax=Psychromicrobium sp. YIM B11713 TaxID=3145233 RepID=UPI00374F3859
MMNFEHLRTFVTVYRAGSLTEAANLLGISQPTVSAHIQSLEAVFGFALFVRNHSGVSATGKGSELARELAAHVDALDDIAALSASASTQPRAIHIGGPAELLGTMVMPRLRELSEAVGAPLWFEFGLADDLLEELRTGSLDAVISAIRPRINGITATALYDEEFVLVAAPAWQQLSDSAVTSDINRWTQIPVIAYAENLPIVRRYWRTVFGRRPQELRLSAVVPDLRSIRSALIAGAGMSVLPHYLVTEDLKNGALTLLHTPEFAPLNTVHLATRSGDISRIPRLRSLADELSRIIR